MKPRDYMPPRRERRDMTVLMAVNEISRLFGRAIKISEKPGSAMSQDSFRLILIALSHHDGATQLELSGITHLKPPTISITVEKMESLGYVVRKRDEHDLRALRVYLTDKGRREHDERLADIRAIESVVTRDLSDEERNAIMDILMKMRKNLYEINEIEYTE
jgi:DNA-binding MarR family transcriptional regulator